MMTTAENGTAAPASAAMVPVPPPAPMMEHAPPWMPRSMKQIGRLCEIIVQSGLAPAAIYKARDPKAACFVVVTTGLELGLGVMQALRHIACIDGKPCLSSSLIVARCKRSPVCKYFQVEKMDRKECICVTHREGDPQPTRLAWTIDDAKDAGLLGKDNWKKYPRAMLRNRCQAELARAVYPDLVDGLYDPDELGAITTEDGDVIDVPADPPSAPRSVAMPPGAPPKVDPAEAFKSFEQRLSVIAKTGTLADLKTLARELAAHAFTPEQSALIDEIYALTAEAIEAREQNGGA